MKLEKGWESPGSCSKAGFLPVSIPRISGSFITVTCQIMAIRWTPISASKRSLKMGWTVPARLTMADGNNGARGPSNKISSEDDIPVNAVSIISTKKDKLLAHQSRNDPELFRVAALGPF